MGRVDGGYLTGERLSVGDVGCPIVPRGAHHAHARAKHDDTGEEHQRFAFGGRRHDDKIVSPITNCTICLFQTRLILRAVSISLDLGACDECMRFENDLPRPPGVGDASTAVRIEAAYTACVASRQTGRCHQ
jgi:hypothetical protein